MKDINHERFQKFVAESDEIVDFMIKVLRGRGYVCEKMGMRISPERKRWKEFVDHGDIVVRKPYQGMAEVKRRGFEFTSQEDWKYPDVFVCAKHSFDMRKEDLKPKEFFYLNTRKTHYARLDVVSTFKFWETRRATRDHRYIDYAQDLYSCPTNLLSFFPVSEADPSHCLNICRITRGMFEAIRCEYRSPCPKYEASSQKP